MRLARPIGSAIYVPEPQCDARPAFVRYGMAVLIVGAMALVSLWLRPYSYSTPFLFFFPAVVAAAWIGGFRPGLFATAIATIVANQFLLPPYRHLSFDVVNILRSIFFALGLVFICYSTEIVRQRLHSVIDVQSELLKNAQASLRNMEERARMAANAAGLGYWDWDFLKKERVWSEKCKALFGLEGPGEISYPVFLSALHPEDRAKTDAALKRALDDRSEYNVEYRAIWPDGTIHWIASWGHAFYDDSGNAVRMSGVVQEVTARKQVEDALRMSERIAAVGRMAGALAHEINNPLDAVKNLVYLFGQTPGMDDSSREYLRLMEGEVERIQNIVANTLSFYRESNTPVPVQLSEVMESVLHLYARRIQNKRLRIDKRIDCNIPVWGFPGELRQVFSNLVANAIEASETNGTLKLHVYCSPNWTDGEARGVRVVVADAGHGVATDVRSKLFEPFFTTKGEKGTGLGLWVSQGIVKKHRGSIRLRSSTRQGQSGTCFSVFLPLQATADENSGGRAASAAFQP